ERADYRSVPDPKCSFVGPIDLFSTVEAHLQPPHQRFIEVVGRKRSGAPVSGSSHRKSHSAGLMAYARSCFIMSAERFVSPDEIPCAASLVEGAVCRIMVN